MSSLVNLLLHHTMLDTMNLTFVKKFIKEHRHEAIVITAEGGDIPSRHHGRLDLHYLDSEEKHLYVLKLLMYKCHNIHCVDMVHYYVKMNYTRCLQLLSLTTNINGLAIALGGLHYCNIAALQLASSFGHYNGMMYYYFEFPMPHNAFVMWQDIMFDTSSLKLYEKAGTLSTILKEFHKKIPLNQIKLLIHFALKHRHRYTLPLIKLIKDDYHRMLLLSKLFSAPGLEDVHHMCTLFMLTLICQ